MQKNTDKFHLLSEAFTSLTSCKSHPLNHPLKQLKLQNIVQIQTNCSLEQAEYLVSCCPELSKLGLIKVYNFDANINQLAKLIKNSSLKWVGISCGQMTQIKEPFDTIKQLSINLDQIRSLEKLLQKFPGVVKICLAGVRKTKRDQISENKIMTLANLKSLQQLYMKQFVISIQNINKLLRKLPHLEVISFEQCEFKQIHGCSIQLPMLKTIQMQIDFFNSQNALNIIKAIGQKQIPLKLKMRCFGMTLQKQKSVIQFLLENHLKLISFYLLFGKQELLADLLKTQFYQSISLYESKIVNPIELKNIVVCNQQLKVLSFDYCVFLGDQSVQIISTLKNLQKLTIKYCQLTNKGFVYLKKLKQLQFIIIADNQISQYLIVSILCNLKSAWRKRIRKAEAKKNKKNEENTRQVKHII